MITSYWNQSEVVGQGKCVGPCRDKRAGSANRPAVNPPPTAGLMSDHRENTDDCRMLLISNVVDGWLLLCCSKANAWSNTALVSLIPSQFFEPPKRNDNKELIEFRFIQKRHFAPPEKVSFPPILWNNYVLRAQKVSVQTRAEGLSDQAFRVGVLAP